MSCLEHLVENGIYLLEKSNIHYTEWHEIMKKDCNWRGVERINIDDLWEICQYVTCSSRWDRHYWEED